MQKVLAMLASLFLMLTICGCSMLGQNPKTPKVYVPDSLMRECVENLPEAEAGTKAEIQQVNSLRVELYHECAQRHNDTVEVLKSQGVGNYFEKD